MTKNQIIALMFGVFGQASDINRQELYSKLLQDVPVSLLEKAVHKVVIEWDKGYLPPPSIILNAARALYSSGNEAARIKSWDEAWCEIDKAMLATPWGKTPSWSTKEIAAAVNAFGWQNLHCAMAGDMPTIRAQVRRFYEDACNRTLESNHNSFVMGTNKLGIIGAGETENLKIAEKVSAVLPAWPR